LGNAGRAIQILDRGVIKPEADVLRQGFGEEESLLHDVTDILAQALHRIFLDVDAVHKHATFLALIKTADQVDDGGLSGAGRPHDGQRVPRRHVKGDVFQNGLVPVGEVDMVELNVALKLLGVSGVGHVLELGPDIDIIEHALTGGFAEGDLIDDVGKLAHGVGDHP